MDLKRFLGERLVEMENKMVCVPYSDFVDGVCAQADLGNIKAIVENGSGYCSDDIKSILGIEVKKNDATN